MVDDMINVKNLSTEIKKTDEKYDREYRPSETIVCELMSSYPEDSESIQNKSRKLQEDIKSNCTGSSSQTCSGLETVLTELLEKSEKVKNGLESDVSSYKYL